MKSMFENFITMVVMVILMFVLSSIMVTNMQIQTARRVHSGVVEQYQTSYYTVNVDDINAEIQEVYPNWVVTVREISNVASRKDAEITLTYDVVVPVFNITKTGEIVGYAR